MKIAYITEGGGTSMRPGDLFFGDGFPNMGDPHITVSGGTSIGLGNSSGGNCGEPCLIATKSGTLAARRY